MTKPICLFISFMLSAAIFSQQADMDKPFRKMAIGITLSPDYCFKIASGSDKSYVYSGTDQHNYYKIGYTARFNFNYFFKKKFCLETGLLFSDKGYKSKITFPAWITPNGIYDPALPEQSTYTYHIFYLDIPIHAMLFLGNEKLQGILTGGITTNILLWESVTEVSKIADGTERTSHYHASPHQDVINISPAFGGGINYKIKDRISLRAKIIAQQTLASYVSQYDGGHLFTFGMNLGCFISI